MPASQVQSAPTADSAPARERRRVLVRSLNRAFDALQIGKLTEQDLVDAWFLVEEDEDVSFYGNYYLTGQWPSVRHRVNAHILRRALVRANQDGRVVWKNTRENLADKFNELLIKNGCASLPPRSGFQQALAMSALVLRCGVALRLIS